MPNCAVYGCKNDRRKTKGTDVKYYSFPQDNDLSKKWTIACHRQDKFKVEYARICSKHFSPSAHRTSLRHQLLNYQPRNDRDLKPEAVPTEFLPYQKIKSESVIRRNKMAQELKENCDRKELVNKILEHAEESLKSSDADTKSDNLTTIPTLTKEAERLIAEANILNLTKQLEKVGTEIACLKNENESLKKVNKSLERNLASVNYKLDTVFGELKKHFTPGQIKRLLNPFKKTTRWTPEDMVSAHSLRSVSPKAYEYLFVNNYPLPAPSTLRKWAASNKATVHHAEESTVCENHQYLHQSTYES